MELCLKHDLNRTTLQRWSRTVRKHGYEALLELKRRGSPGTAQWAKAIDELRPQYPLDLLLELRKMARSVFYYHLKQLQVKDKYADEKALIKSIFHEHKGRYGYRRITAEMRNRGFNLNHKIAI